MLCLALGENAVNVGDSKKKESRKGGKEGRRKERRRTHYRRSIMQKIL